MALGSAQPLTEVSTRVAVPLPLR